MEVNIKLLLLSIGLCFAASASADSISNTLPTFLEKAKNAQYAAQIQSENLDMNGMFNEHYPSGIAYGAQATKLVEIPFERLKAYLATPGTLLKFVETVKTQTKVAALKTADREIDVKLEIKVPVVENFRTQDHVGIRELPDGRRVLEWAQIGSDGDLVSNQGMAIAEPAGDKTKIFVVGTYIIKAERKVPWVGRGTATKFARDHFSNYITALETLLTH